MDVWVRGIGLGIPLITVFTQLFGANTLNKKGETSWDKSHGFDVRCGKLRFGRVFGALILALLLFMALGALSGV